MVSELQVFILRNFSWQFYLLSQFMLENCQRNIFIFRFAGDVRPAFSLTFNKPAHTLPTKKLKPSEKGNTTLICGQVHRSLFGGFYTRRVYKSIDRCFIITSTKCIRGK